jgi:hypothetical protein
MRPTRYTTDTGFKVVHVGGKSVAGWDGGNGTRFEPVQRLGGYPEASQRCGFSHPRRMSHLASNRHHDLPGERRTARARPTDGRA